MVGLPQESRQMEHVWSALVIDDDPGVRQSLRLCLESENPRVLGVGTAAGALDAIERSRFDVVFLDLWLQAESGLSVLPEILRRQPGVGVIVITAFATFESAVEAMKMGAVDYLPKPFTPDQVRTAARRVVTANLLKRQLTELQDRLHETEEESTFETRSAPFAMFLQNIAPPKRSRRAAIRFMTKPVSIANSAARNTSRQFWKNSANAFPRLTTLTALRAFCLLGGKDLTRRLALFPSVGGNRSVRPRIGAAT
jgi:ActR/RegA family two-component response regulator